MSTLKEHQTVMLELLREFNRICEIAGIPYMMFAGSLLGAVRHQGFIPWDDDLDVVMLRDDYERFIKEAPKYLDEKKYYLQAEFTEHWPLHFTKLRKNSTTCLEKYHPKDKNIHQGIYIDIFPCDNASNNKVIRKIQFISSRIVLAKSLNKRGYETDSILKKLICLAVKIFPLKPFYKISILKNKNSTRYVHTFFGGTSKYKKGVYLRKWFETTTRVSFEDMSVPISVEYHQLLRRMYGDYMKIPKEEEKMCKAHAILVDVINDYSKYADYREGMEWSVFTRSIR